MAQRLDPVPLSASRPGISKRDSALALGERWIDGDHIRFVDGKPQKIGGWAPKTQASVDDAIRGLLAWTTMRLAPFIGFGTHRKLYVADQALLPTDITPLESEGSLNDPFMTTAGSSTVRVTHAEHARSVGDAAIFSNASLFAGILIDGDYEIIAIEDDDHYFIEHSEAAISEETGGGTVAYSYVLPIGETDPSEGDGYGAGGYGLGDYGEPSESGEGSIVFEPRAWSLDQYGDLMLAAPVNGGIYQFDPNETPAYQRAARLENSPAVCRSMFVTPERFIFALGVDNDPMNVKWADQDDPTNWTPGSASTANSRRLVEGTRIIGGKGIANRISGVWTDTAMYRFQYTGSSFIYDSLCVGTNCGLVSPMALVVHLGVAYWMSRNNFLMSSGGTPTPIPNSEDIREHVIRALRGSGYEYKCNAYLNTRFNEVWFFYVATGSTEPGLYVAVSLTDYSWVVGTLERTSGGFFKSGDQLPVLAGADGWLYQHESGTDADGAVLPAFITRAPMQLAQGARLGEVNGLVNDMQRQIGSMSVEVKTWDRINEGVLDRERAYFEPGEDLVDLRVGGRIAGVTLRSAVLGGDFRLGAPTLEVIATGSRR